MAEKAKTKAQLETEIAELRSALEAANRDRRQAQAVCEQTLADKNDLKERLSAAEFENQRMRGYISRVQEDDVVREELVLTGDPNGEQRLMPKRRPERFDAPSPFIRPTGRDHDGHFYMSTAAEKAKPRHWVTY